jgi:hypothetical protein
MREPLALMSSAQRDSYLDWLLTLVGRRKGSIADFYRKAAAQLRERDFA